MVTQVWKGDRTERVCPVLQGKSLIHIQRKERDKTMPTKLTCVTPFHSAALSMLVGIVTSTPAS